MADGGTRSIEGRGGIEGPLLAECYDELRRISRRMLARDWGRLPIQPTELAHEAMLRLLQIDRMRIEDRQHLLALAARMARQALIDEARRAGTRKRDGSGAMMTLVPDFPAPARLEDVHAAVEALTDLSPDHARIVELRFTLGLTIEETAEATGLSPRTIKRRWATARAWLQDWLDRHGG